MDFVNEEFDKTQFYENDFAPLVDIVVKECYNEGIPVLAMAAIKNTPSETVYAGRVITPEHLGISLYNDIFTGYPDDIVPYGDAKTLESSEYDKWIKEASLSDKKGGVYFIQAHAERLQTIAMNYEMPFVFIMATANDKTQTKFQGAISYHKTRGMLLTEDRFTPMILKVVEYNPYGDFEIETGTL